MPDPAVKKGTITYLLERSSYDLEFMYNPETVYRDHGYAHGSAQIGGRSHPFYGGGCGEEETIRFRLVLDADRGYLERRISNNPNVLDPAWYSWKLAEDAFRGYTDVDTLEDLGPVIDLFRTLVLPEDTKSAPLGDYGVPPRYFLDLGSVAQEEVGFDKITVEYDKYSPRLTVIKAYIDVVCHVVRQKNLTNAILMSYHTPRREDDTDIVLISSED